MQEFISPNDRDHI